MSFKPEFKVGSEWCANGVAFATKEESDANALDKFMVWTMPSDWRSVESDQPVNYTYHNHRLEPVEQETK